LYFHDIVLVYDLLKVIIIPAYSKNPWGICAGQRDIISDFLLPYVTSVASIN